MRPNIYRISIMLAVVIALAAGIPSSKTEVTVRYGPTAPWIVVLHFGQLTAEWQPSDGHPYQILKQLLEDDLRGERTH